MADRPLTVIVLAAQRAGVVNPLAERAGVSHKCLAPICGRALIEWVLEVVTAQPDLAAIRISIEPEAQAEVARLKAEPAGDCTTTPAFIDSATRLFQGNFDNRLTVRLSAYKTPGCNGHLSTIYLLDVLRGDALMRTFQASQNHGPL